MNARTLLTASLCLLLPLTGAAQESPRNLAIVPIEVLNADEPSAAQIMAALREAAAKHPGLSEKSPIQLSLDEARMTFSCLDEQQACMAELGKQFEADLLLWGHLDKSADGALVLDLRLLDVSTATLVRSKAYPPGSLEAQRTNARQFVAPAPQQLLVTIHSQPSGAQVVIDGVVKGTTPAQFRLPPATYQLELRGDGVETLRRSIEIGGEPLELNETLTSLMPAVVEAPLAKPPAERSKTGLYLGIGAGAVALGSGVGWLVVGLDVWDLENQAEGMRDTAERATLQDEHDSKQLITNFLIGATAVSALTSVYFLAFYEDGAAEEVVLAPSGDGFVISGRF